MTFDELTSHLEEEIKDIAYEIEIPVLKPVVTGYLKFLKGYLNIVKDKPNKSFLENAVTLYAKTNAVTTLYGFGIISAASMLINDLSGELGEAFDDAQTKTMAIAETLWNTKFGFGE